MPSKFSFPSRAQVSIALENEIRHACCCQCLSVSKGSFSPLSRILFYTAMSFSLVAVLMVVGGAWYFNKPIPEDIYIAMFNEAVRSYRPYWAFGREGSGDEIVEGGGGGNTPTAEIADDSAGLMPMQVSLEAVTPPASLSVSASEAAATATTISTSATGTTVVTNTTLLPISVAKDFYFFDDDDEWMLYADRNLPVFNVLPASSGVARGTVELPTLLAKAIAAPNNVITTDNNSTTKRIHRHGAVGGGEESRKRRHLQRGRVESGLGLGGSGPLRLTIQFNSSGRGPSSLSNGAVAAEEKLVAPPPPQPLGPSAASRLTPHQNNNINVNSHTNHEGDGASSFSSPPLVITRDIPQTQFDVLHGAGLCPSSPLAPSPDNNQHCTLSFMTSQCQRMYECDDCFFYPTTATTAMVVEEDEAAAGGEGKGMLSGRRGASGKVFAHTADRAPLPASSSSMKKANRRLLRFAAAKNAYLVKRKREKNDDDTDGDYESEGENAHVWVQRRFVTQHIPRYGNVMMVVPPTGKEGEEGDAAEELEEEVVGLAAEPPQPSPQPSSSSQRQHHLAAQTVPLGEGPLCPHTNTPCGLCVHTIYLHTYCLVINFNKTTGEYEEDVGPPNKDDHYEKWITIFGRHRYCVYPFNPSSLNETTPITAENELVHFQQFSRVEKYGDAPPTTTNIEVRTSDDPFLTQEEVTEGTGVFYLLWPSYRPVGALLVYFGFLFFVMGMLSAYILWKFSRTFTCCYSGRRVYEDVDNDFGNNAVGGQRKNSSPKKNGAGGGDPIFSMIASVCCCCCGGGEGGSTSSGGSAAGSVHDAASGSSGREYNTIQNNTTNADNVVLFGDGDRNRNSGRGRGGEGGGGGGGGVRESLDNAYPLGAMYVTNGGDDGGEDNSRTTASSLAVINNLSSSPSSPPSAAPRKDVGPTTTTTSDSTTEGNDAAAGNNLSGSTADAYNATTTSTANTIAVSNSDTTTGQSGRKTKTVGWGSEKEKDSGEGREAQNNRHLHLIGRWSGHHEAGGDDGNGDEGDDKGVRVDVASHGINADEDAEGGGDQQQGYFYAPMPKALQPQ